MQIFVKTLTGKIITIRSVVSPKKKNHFTKLLFIRFLAVPSLAHFTPYFSDSASSENDHDISVTNYPNNHNNNNNNSSEFNSSRVVEILKDMRCEPTSALSFFNQLKENGFQHDIETYLAIIKILCYWGLDRNLDSLFIDVIKNSKNEHLSFKVSDLLDAIAEEHKASGRLLLAFDGLIKSYVNLEMFDEAIDTLVSTKGHGVGPCLFSCNFLMNRLIGHREVDTAVAIYKQMKNLGLTPNVYTYGIVIKGHCIKGNLEEAGKVFFSEMVEAQVVPNAFTYTTYLQGLCTQGKSDIGYEFLRTWKDKNAPLDEYAYSVVIQGFVGENKLDKAEIVLREMEENGLLPDEATYRALIRGYCECGNIDKALTIGIEMEEKGIKTNCFILTPILQCLCKKGMYPDVVDQFKKFKRMSVLLDEAAYNVAMDASCKMGEMDEAFRLFDEMTKCRNNLVPDVRHYTTLINGCCLNGYISDALNLFEEMDENGPKADVITYNVLISGLFRNGLINEVFILLDNMKSHRLTPNAETHRAIIEGLCSVGKVKEAENYFSNLEEKSFENYASMVNGYCLSGDANKGYKFFHKFFENQGVSLPRNCCLKLIDSLCLEGENDRAIMVLSSSEDGPSKEMYSKLIAALCRAGDMERAKWAFDDMVGRGLSPDVVMYTMMMNGYCLVKCLNEALALFKDMKERGIKPDIITFTVLLDGHCKIIMKTAKNSRNNSTLIKEVGSAIWCEMKEMGLEADVIWHTALIDSWCKSGNTEDAKSVLGGMIDGGKLLPDIVTYTALISGYCKKGDMKKAYDLVDEMSSKGIMPNTRTVSTLSSLCKSK